MDFKLNTRYMYLLLKNKVFKLKYFFKQNCTSKQQPLISVSFIKTELVD